MPARNLVDEEVSVPEAITRVLEEAGVDFIFGMPGGRTIPIYGALYDHREKVRCVLAREEGLATVMAEAYGRLTGRPGVCMGQAAWILTNSGMGLVEACLSGTPVLVLSDMSDRPSYSQHAPYQTGTGDYGTWDARNTIAGYTKQTFVAREPAAAVQVTQLAIKHALTGQPGPVAVLYHTAALTARVGPNTTPHLYSTGPYVHSERQGAVPARVDAAVETLRRAERPVVIAGNGVRISQARERLLALVELLGLPVATTASGKGVFPETHPLALGTFGNFGLEAANAIVAEADLVLAIGTKLGPTDTANENPKLLDPARQTMIQIDIEPRHAAWTMPVEHCLIGDARTVLDQLMEAARRAGLRRNDAASARVADAHRSKASFDVSESSSDESPVLPQRLIKELHRAVPAGATITCDGGENRLFMTHHFQTKPGVEYLQPAAAGGMGYAIPAALAAKLVRRDDPAIAVCGDGGFGVAINGMMTARDEEIPIVVVVLNNSQLGWIRHGQGERPIASTFANYDHAAIARAMGCEGIRVERPDELQKALKHALSCGRPTVVDVVTSDRYTFRDVTSPLAAYP
jgi:acetolactate synthase-1/2/3 large subunit